MHIKTRALAIMMLLCSAALTVHAGSYSQDSQNEAEAKGSVTGQVTVDGKPAQGIIVAMKKSEPSSKRAFEETFKPSAELKTTTDEEGIFRFNDVPVGRYALSPFAPALIGMSENKAADNTALITVSEGKLFEGVNFALSRGGVITGRVTDAEGRPLIREAISLKGADDSANARPWKSDNSTMMMTDDRGIYRLYGLPPGRYIVSIGNSGTAGFTAKRSIPYTYYPGVTDRAKAKVVEVTQGGEAAGVDIKIPAAAKGLYASGRVIDEAGKPVPNAVIIYTRHIGQGVDMFASYTGNFSASDAKGEFRFNNILPGKYRVMARVSMQQNEFYANPVTMEVKSEDVTGIEIKLRRGSAISGIATIEDVNDPELMIRLAQTYLGANVMGEESGEFSYASGKISPDGTFRISGLGPGKATIAAFSTSGASEFKLSHIEIDGAEVGDDINIKAGDNITGVRLVFALAKGVIRGKVVVSGGKLPAKAYFQIRIYKSGTGEPANSYLDDDTEIDSNGNFVIEGLEAGSYEIEVSAEQEGSIPGNKSQLGTTKQSVVVTNDAPAEMIITLEIKKS